MIHGTSTGSTAWLLVSLAVTVGGLGSVLTTVGEPIAGAPQGRGAGNRDQDRRTRFTHDGTVDDERGSGKKANPDEAATGFDNLTNGFDVQGSSFDSLTADSAVALRSFNDNRFVFEEVETTADGLGPTYNAQSCRECHQNVMTGGGSQVTEQRTGHLSGGNFFESLGGSLIQSRGTHPDAVELVADEDNVRHVPDFHEYSGARIRRGHLELDAYRNPRQPAGEHARIDRDRAGAGSQRKGPAGPLRMEESACEPRIVCGGRVPQ